MGVFGPHNWALVLPQVIEGALTVLVLYRAVRRLAGPAAGLIAAGLLAISPATVALNRGNVSDTLMILLAVLAADSIVSALHHRAVRPAPAGRGLGRPGLPGQDARGVAGAAGPCAAATCSPRPGGWLQRVRRCGAMGLCSPSSSR